ncbi:MAG: 50S ribosomal protein L37ae [Thermoplasmata archaeon]|nr:50S ribosomal protein L37ae [Thermoplasmata archaeon]
MSSTKIGTTGRYGPRYGIKIRRQTASIEGNLRKRHQCPRCLHMSVRRVSTGIWECRRCNLKFAGGAYVPTARRSKIGQEKEHMD